MLVFNQWVDMQTDMTYKMVVFNQWADTWTDWTKDDRL